MGKLVYEGELIRIQNMINRTFVAIDQRCELCWYLTCGVVWFSIKTPRVRCTRRWHPWKEVR